MNVDLVVPRRTLLDALSGRGSAVTPHLTGVMPARSSILIRSGRDRAPLMMWLGATYALIAHGDDPVALGRIRVGGAGLAVLDAVDLRRAGDARAGSWWEMRITTGDRMERIEGFDRSPGRTWLVRHGVRTTRVEPATVLTVARAVCGAVERHTGIATTSSLM